MRALLVHQAVTSRFIAKQNQFLVEDLDEAGYILDFAGQRDGLPVASQIFPAGGALRRPHQNLITFTAQRL